MDNKPLIQDTIDFTDVDGNEQSVPTDTFTKSELISILLTKDVKLNKMADRLCTDSANFVPNKCKESDNYLKNLPQPLTRRCLWNGNPF